MLMVGKGFADSEKDDNSRIFATEKEKSPERIFSEQKVASSVGTGLPYDSQEAEDKFVSTIKFANKIL